jgi:hypothetical protein
MSLMTFVEARNLGCVLAGAQWTKDSPSCDTFRQAPEAWTQRALDDRLALLQLLNTAPLPGLIVDSPQAYYSWYKKAHDLIDEASSFPVTYTG